jgi:Tol biopolymer transport system component/imidazolonepropionase-like amidohydrolase
MRAPSRVLSGAVATAIVAGSVTALGAGKADPPVAAPDCGQTRVVEFEVGEGTWTSLDVSPDGKTIVFDLLGDIYALPIEGGRARLLAGGPAWEHQPRFSPDGREIAFASDREGMMNLWVMEADGSGVRPVTQERKQAISTPTWTPDGGSIVFRKHVLDPLGLELWTQHRSGGTGVALTARDKVRGPEGPCVSPDGRYLYFSSRVAGEYSFYENTFVVRNQLQRLDLNTGETVRLTFGPGGGFRPTLSRDGRLLAYARRAEHRMELRVRDLSTGEDRLLAPSIDLERTFGLSQEGVFPGYAFTPDGRSVILTIDGQIHRIGVADRSDRVIPFRAPVRQTLAELVRPKLRIPDEQVSVSVIRWPALSPDGRQLAFSSLGKLWIMDLPGGVPRRLTSSPEAEYAPRFSPDGAWIAYTTWSDAARGGHLRLISPDGKRNRQLTSVPREYQNPAWSPDGTRIAFVVGNGGLIQLQIERDMDFSHEVRWIAATGGPDQIITNWKRSLAEIAHPELYFSADGGRIFYAEVAPGEPDKRALVSVRLDGAEKTRHLVFPSGDQVAVSPDGQRLAIIRAASLYVVSLPGPGAQAIPIALEGGSALTVTRIARGGVSYVRWEDPDSLVWTVANRLWRVRLQDGGRPGGPEMVTQVALTVPSARPRGTLAFTDARIVTMENNVVLERGTVIIRENRIEAVGPSDQVRPPAGAVTVDAGGRTVIPGLVDTHAHVHLLAYDTYPQQSWKHVMTLAYGTTTAYDPYSRTVEAFELRDMLDSGVLVGPRLFSSGSALEGRFMGGAWALTIEDIEHAREVVQGFAAYGAGPLKEYSQQRRDQRQYLAQAAREAGVGLAGEPNSDFVRRTSMVLDGFTAVEHSFTVPVREDVMRLWAQSGTCHTPTFAIPDGGAGLLDYFTAQVRPEEMGKIRRFAPQGHVEEYRHWRVVPREDLYFLEQARMATELSRAGGCSTVGSHSTRVGLGMHWEIWARVLAGAKPMEALRDATLAGARKLGLEHELGSLKPGKRADLLVLTADPLADIRNTTAVEYVVKDGLVYDAESMDQLWPKRKRLDRFFWQTEEDVQRTRPPERHYQGWSAASAPATR